MQRAFPEIEYLVPLKDGLEAVFASRALEPCSEEAIAFLAKLSAALLKDPAAKAYPDVVSFGFWCRPSALRAVKERFSREQLRLGRGVVFHIAPSNVPVNFAYSLVSGLLAGNANVIRVPTKRFVQVDLICSAIRALLETKEFSALANYLVPIRYERNKEVTDYLSSRCDVRVIWGGDQSIAEIRRSPLPARAFDMVFSDRYSFCVIDADAYLDAGDRVGIGVGFYNDTYLFDQNACTAPHLVVWLGAPESVRKAQELFWGTLHEVVAEKYELQAVSSVNKLADSYKFAATRGAGECGIPRMPDNLIVRIRLDRLTPGLEESRSVCGLFYEYEAAELDEVLPLINRKFQTLAYYGIEPGRLEAFITRCRPAGIDRMVPIGRTLDFSLMWDGYDLVSMLSRVVYLGAQGGVSRVTAAAAEAVRGG